MLMYVSLDLKDVSVSKNTTEELIMNKRTTPEGKNTTEGRKVYTLVQMNGVRFFQDCAKCGQPTMPTSERTCPTLFFPHANIRASNMYQIQHMKLAGEWGTLHQCCFRVEGMTIDPIISPLFAI